MYSIVGMIRESNDDNNPIHIQEQFTKELKEIYNLIAQELNLQYTQPDGLETGDEGDYDF